MFVKIRLLSWMIDLVPVVLLCLLLVLRMNMIVGDFVLYTVFVFCALVISGVFSIIRDIVKFIIYCVI